MAASIDYFVTSISPWAYLGHDAARELAVKHGATLNVRPVNLGEMFKVSGQVALGERAPVRQRYRFIELQRYADMRGKNMNFKPKHFPTNPALADHTICAIVADGGNPLEYVGSVFAAVWAHERDVAEEAVISDLLTESGFDAQAVIEKAASPEVAAIRAKNTEDAVAADATGVPSFVLDGEPFWGQDKLDVLDHALTTGRGPFKTL